MTSNNHTVATSLIGAPNASVNLYLNLAESSAPPIPIILFLEMICSFMNQVSHSIHWITLPQLELYLETVRLN